MLDVKSVYVRRHGGYRQVLGISGEVWRQKKVLMFLRMS